MKSRMLVASALIGLLLVIAGKGMSHAQSGAGSIQGTVTDATGAVIPAASIHVVNVATGVKTDTKSNGVGFYQVPELFTSTYSVTVTAPGMETYTTSIELLVAQNAVINPILTAGAVTQQVVVAGDTVQLTTTDNGAISSTLENARINQLPMNGRFLTNLLSTTTPGLENGGKDIDGLMPSAVIYTVDGVSTQDNLRGGLYYGSGGSQLIDPDSVQEVRMEALNAGAEYATPATAIITTKSGTNAMHGTAFETARNNAIGIAKSRQNPSSYSAPHLVRNEFGFSAGGPIILPHIYHGKDKSFWFFAYERFSLAQEVSTLTTWPTQTFGQGNFSGLVNSSGVLQTLYDPATTTHNPACPVPSSTATTNNLYCRQSFTQEYNETGSNVNSIPSSEISPVAKLYYQLLPPPTTTADPLVTSNYTAETPELNLEPQITIRLDHEFNEKNRAYLHYSQNQQGTNISSGPQNLAYNSNGINIPAGAAVSQAGFLNNPTDGYYSTVSFTHVFSPTFFSETIASQQWFSEKKLPGASALTPTTDYESKLNLPNNFGEEGFPLINGMIFQLGSSQTNTAKENQIISSIDENLTKTMGHHQMLFGGRYRHQRMAQYPQQSADTFNFGANPTALYNPSSGANYTAYTSTGYADASFFLGNAASYQVWLHGGWNHYHDNEVDAYYQDNYHISKNITLNLGLRYEAHPAIWTKDGKMTGFDLANDAEVLSAPISTLISEGWTTQAIITNDENIGVKFETAAQAGLPANTLMRNYNLNFLPRIGIAYQPFDGKYGTVVRAAYGRFANPMPLEDYVEYVTGGQNPFTVPFSQSYATANQAVDGLPNELLRYNDSAEFGVMGVNTANVINTSSTNGILPGIADESVSPDSPPQFITEVNFTVEQQLKGNSALRVSWIWTHATNLAFQHVYNNALSTYAWEIATGTTPPTGGYSVIGTPQQNTYSSTALGPYDQTTWGGNEVETRTGWSNDNLAQITYQRIFHHGVAYQISYVFSRDLRAGGDNLGSVPPTIDPDADYPGILGSVGTMTSPYGTVYAGSLPPPRPSNLPVWADYHAMDKYQGYGLDAGDTPIHHVTFNGIFDLPVGRGKRFLGNANRFWDELVGGFQIAGDGSVFSQAFQPTSASNWGATNPVQLYKKQYPILDCRSGVCEHSFMWYNGYLAPTVLPAPLGTCTTNCVTGLPSSYVPVQTPVDNTPGTTNYGNNDVAVTLANKTTVTVPYIGGPADSSNEAGGTTASNYLGKTWIPGPFNYTADLSVYKVFPINERMNLRLNVDAFNVLNVQGWNNPGTGGVQNNLSSFNTPRQIQFTLRLSF
ncbi:MAG: carboxypeptidase-like regulatory domain-containing protein [Terracidiphilus sp.]